MGENDGRAGTTHCFAKFLICLLLVACYRKRHTAIFAPLSSLTPPPLGLQTSSRTPMLPSGRKRERKKKQRKKEQVEAQLIPAPPSSILKRPPSLFPRCPFSLFSPLSLLASLFTSLLEHVHLCMQNDPLSVHTGVEKEKKTRKKTQSWRNLPFVVCHGSVSETISRRPLSLRKSLYFFRFPSAGRSLSFSLSTKLTDFLISVCVLKLSRQPCPRERIFLTLSNSWAVILEPFKLISINT